MREIVIQGGRPLQGEVAIHGAKNSVLPILAATILNGGISVIHNCPKLTDVTASIEILRHLGCQVDWDGETVTVDSGPMCRSDVPSQLMREMRSSVIFLGAILARTGEAHLSMPGGCELGPRPIDLHLRALRTMGAEISDSCGILSCTGGRQLRGCRLTLSIASVGATENAMLAACGASGVTIIGNAAREPEIVDLQNFLVTMGAKIAGAGTSTIRVEGRQCFHSCAYRVMADRIVAATYLSAAAAAGGEVAVTGVDSSHLATLSALLQEAGCGIREEKSLVELTCHRPLGGTSPVRTAPYPGFPTDAQPTLMAALARGTGTTVFVENIFENRYRHVGEMTRMGANIRVEGRVAVVCGVPRLHGAAVEAADLRGGAALVVAALGAEGESRITGIHHICRGYARLEEDLTALGADIKRL